MAITIHENGGHIQYGTVIYTADTAADLPNLPTKITPGSTCFVIDTGITYILNNKEQWIEFYGSSGGGSEYPNADVRRF